MSTALAVQVALIAGMNFLGAFVQASTGFGYALIAMPLMALLLPMASCSAISAVTIVLIGLQMSLKLRAHLKVGTILVPMLCCFASINAGLYFLARFDELLLRLILSVLLVGVTTVSFLMRRTKVKRMYGRWPFAVAAGLLTGLSAGMFNVVGPFLMLYYLHVCENTLDMKASLEFSFLLAGLYASAMHLFAYRNINVAVVPHMVASMAAAIGAGYVGLGIYKKLNRDVITRLVYILLPVMALVLVIDSTR